MNREIALRLAPALGRLRLRRTFDYVTKALIGGFVLDALLLLGPSTALSGLSVLLVLPVLAIVFAAAVALWRGPTIDEAARAVDSLGLDEQVSSALYAGSIEHATSSLIARRALAGLETVDVRDIAVAPSTRRLRTVAGAAVVLLAVALLPLPRVGEDPAQTAERAAINETRDDIEELAAAVEEIAPASTREELARELSTLDQALAKAESREQAAEALERAQERIASLVDSEQYTANRTLNALATAMSSEPQLGELAQAIRERDAEAIAEALESLAERLPGFDALARQRVELAMQSAANLAQDMPGLAGELRNTATALRNEGAAASTSGLSDALAAAATEAQALASTQTALSGLGSARAGLGASSAQASGSGSQGSGTSSGQGSNGSGSEGSSGASGSSGQGSNGSNGIGSGQGSGSGSGQGSGQGAGSGSGQGAGTGQSGTGTGSGAGVGGGPTPGTPGGPDATSGGVGGNAAPNLSGAVPYASVYTPSLLGGADGVSSDVTGDAIGASGQTVDLPQSPVTAGSLRPYNEVYGEYEAAARQALGRGTLPSSLEKLVQDYFSALAPAGSTGQ